jgi:hypothetical protein
MSKKTPSNNKYQSPHKKTAPAKPAKTKATGTVFKWCEVSKDGKQVTVHRG